VSAKAQIHDLNLIILLKNCKLYKRNHVWRQNIVAMVLLVYPNGLSTSEALTIH
jgi:hypothetical protein